MEDIKQQITDDIILRLEKAIEEGVLPWSKSWSSGQPPFNASSGKAYQGINFLILLLHMQAHGGDARHLTYKQAQHMGLQVRRGERGARVIKLVEVERKRARQAAGTDGEIIAEENDKALILKAYTVFNANQIDGMAPMPARECDVKPAEAVEAIVWGLQDDGMKLNFGHYQPAYDLRKDEIRIPTVEQFHSLDDFHATILHECAHASGHLKRLARPHMHARFGSAEYSREELRAELSGLFMQGIIGLPPGQTVLESSASYLSSWLEVLRNDKNEIFRAAADAQRICDYLSERALNARPRANENPCAEPEPEPEPVLVAKAVRMKR
jgi:antirestriction protein ArdC